MPGGSFPLLVSSLPPNMSSDSVPSLHPSPTSSALLRHTVSLPDDHKEKKPRVRHTDVQLAALNELYEENQHPSTEDRAILADQLGMETKAVNAWFANKRSATKKKIKGPAASYDTPPPSTRTADIATEQDDEDDEWAQQQFSWSTPPPSHLEFPPSRNQTPFPSDHRHVFDGESAAGIPRRMRMRPSPKQTEELRKLFSVNSHPSREEREELGSRIGMRYQSVTNWFQNQRSLAKKRKEDEVEDAQIHAYPQDIQYTDPSIPEPRMFTAFPPASSHPSLASNAAQSDAPSRRSDANAKPFGTRRNGSSSSSNSRPRRTRPEPFQLDALKKLFARTANPSIEERGALALEVGMDVGKVTNWFRNLRQTARKRAVQRAINGDDDDGMDFESAPASRMGTPSPPSSSTSSSINGDGDAEQMDLDGEEGHHAQYSEMGSEEDYQEAVTPPPVVSPSPPPVSKNVRRRMDLEFLTGSPTKPMQLTKNATSGVRVEDAMLLLSFSQFISQW